MFDKLLAIIAPHYCYRCGKIGSILCDNCKKYITSRSYASCVLCGRIVKKANLCGTHRQSYDTLWCFGLRQGAIKRIIDDYKFHRVRAAAAVLTDLLDSRLPTLPGDVVIVPIPTTSKNMRRRGYDHMLLIAKYLAKRRNLPLSPLLRRRNNVTQHFTKSSKERKRQARYFFEPASTIDPDKTYLIIDDIFTTGATISAAADCLKKAGAKRVEVAVIARHGTP